MDHALGTAATPLAAPSPASRTPVVLHGRWLVAARVTFIAFFALALWLDATTVLRNQSEDCGEWSTCGGKVPVAVVVLGIGLNLLAAATFFGSALLLFRRRSNEVIALLVALFLVTSQAIDFPPDQIDLLATEPVRATLHLLVIGTFATLLVVLFYIFPDGRFTPRWTVIPAAWWAVSLFITFFIFRSLGKLGPLGDLLNFGTILGTIVVAQVYRYRRVSGPVERQRTKWFLGGLGVALVTFFVGNIILSATGALDPAASGGGIELIWAAFSVAFAFATLCVPVGLTIAVLRYRLFDIDVIINRAIVYGGLTIAVVSLYVLVVGYLGTLFRTGSNLVISLVATGLVAVLFQPIRSWLQRGANRLLYGERDEPYAVVSRLGRRLEGTLTPDAILPTIVKTVAGALKLPYAAIALGSGNQRTMAAATGTPVATPVRLPLAYQGEPVGELLLAPRAPGEEFSRADRRLLADLARQAGVAAQAVRLADEARQLTADLQASRERLVMAREEERRRMRRDLHDGLGPRLAALTLRLDTARDTLADDPRADALLGDLADRTEEAVADIRRLVYALRPPALDDLGLAGAIQQAAEGYSPGALHIAVNLPQPLPHLPAAVEVAAYRIATEALTNIVRHAGASRCTVRIGLDAAEETLLVEVIDNGIGIAPDRRAGIGTTSMRERAEELGGVCTIEPAPGGGTRVHATLPCRPLSDDKRGES